MTCCSSLTPLTSAKTSPAHPFSTSPRHGSLGSLSSSVEYERSTERLAAVCEGLCRPTEARLGGAIGAGNVGSVAARRISFGPLRQARPCAEDCFNDEDIVYRCVALAAAVSRSFVGGSTSPSTNSLPRVEHPGATSTNEPMNVLIIMGKILRALPHLRREYPHSTLGGDLFYFGGSTTKLIFNPSPRSRSKLRFERGARLTDDCSVVTHCRCLLLDLVMLGADLGVPRLVANRHFVANNERKRTSKPCREQLHDASATSYKMTLFTK